MAMNKTLIGVGLAAAAGAAFLLSSEGEAKAGTKDKAPDGTDLKDLALVTTISLTTQNIPDIRGAVAAWKSASDPLTAGALEFTLDGAVSGVNLAQSTLDGEKGSPMLRAFGLRVLQLEGRPNLLRIWAKAWDTILPNLSEALRAKAGDIKPSPEDGNTDDAIPDEATLKRIIQALSSGNPSIMRQLADELERRGFPEQAKDLRAAAEAIEKKQVPPPVPPAPGPAPSPDVPGPGPAPSPVPPKPQPVPPAPDPKPSPVPAPTSGATYVVQPNDNPSKIAKAFTGNPNRWPELVKANAPPKKKAKDGNFATLVAGEVLKLPASWPTKPGAGDAKPVQPTPTSGATYTVLPNDNPSKIAQKITGNPNRWTELVAANSPPKKRAANGNFATLNAGEVLKLPASWPKAPGGVSPAPSPSPSPVPGPSSVVGATYTVLPNDNPSKIAQKLTGNPNRWRELVAANSPPKKKAPDGNFAFLNAGEVLKVPTSWQGLTLSGEMFFGSDGATSDSIRAGKMMLDAKFHKVKPTKLAQFQHDHQVEPTGQYGPMTALVFCLQYGAVPPLPHVWGSNPVQARKAFAAKMLECASRDPQRADEFQHVARQALAGIN